MKRGMVVGLGRGHTVLDGDPAGQTVGWISTLGAEVCLGTGDTVLDGDPAPPPPKKRGGGTAPPLSASVHCGQTVAHLNYC